MMDKVSDFLLSTACLQTMSEAHFWKQPILFGPAFTQGLLSPKLWAGGTYQDCLELFW